MNALKGVAVVLVIAGAAGLFYGGFNYTKSTHSTQIGPLELQVKDQRTMNVPVWAGVAAIVVGAGILLVPVRT
jgi:TRAP-type C4-dicarboxylate transport system permease small subunit